MIGGLCLNLKTIAGTDIKDACDEAVRLAKLLDIAIEFEFCNIRIFATGRDNPNAMVEYYLDKLKES